MVGWCDSFIVGLTTSSSTTQTGIGYRFNSKCYCGYAQTLPKKVTKSTKTTRITISPVLMSIPMIKEIKLKMTIGKVKLNVSNVNKLSNEEESIGNKTKPSRKRDDTGAEVNVIPKELLARKQASNMLFSTFNNIIIHSLGKIILVNKD
ncbi:hypothetical protein ACTA71_002862 [Dictyostelium dimigraforme]